MAASKLNILIILTFHFIFLYKTDGKYDIIYGKGLRGNRIKVNITKDLLEDADLQTNELIAKYGYPIETHFVTTKDNYIICMHRIPRSGGIPFLLMHAFLDSSSEYIIMGPSDSLGYHLWDKGYDVWIGNARGNRYSRNHTTLTPNDKQFWNFSFHEIGIYDVPAMIDYILDMTRYKKLFYVGVSQGTNVFFVMCSKRPEYNEKIILMHALAPGAFLNHATTLIIKIAPLVDILPPNSFFEILPHAKIYLNSCFDEQLNEVEIYCIDLVERSFGENLEELNMTMVPVLLGHFPAGASVKQLQHFFQLYHSGLFGEYDYGPEENIRKYGTNHPPLYDLSKVTAPVALYFGENDIVAAPADVDNLRRKLPNIVDYYKVPNTKWNHMDFVYGKSIKFLINRHIFNLSSLYRSNADKNFL